MKPTLCRVDAYSAPGFPSPRIIFIIVLLVLFALENSFETLAAPGSATGGAGKVFNRFPWFLKSVLTEAFSWMRRMARQDRGDGGTSILGETGPR